MKLEAKASIQIQKTPEAVFQAIVNPQHMCSYFISESTGPLSHEGEVVWKFAEFSMQIPVKHIELVQNKRISFQWDPETTVVMNLEARNEQSTVVRIIEGAKDFNEKNLAWALGNTEGWANFAACLKAYLEHGINLRNGAFEFLREKA